MRAASKRLTRVSRQNTYSGTDPAQPYYYCEASRYITTAILPTPQAQTCPAPVSSTMSVRDPIPNSASTLLTNLLLQFVPLNPRPMLQQLYLSTPLTFCPPYHLPPIPTLNHQSNPLNHSVNEDVIVRLKWGQTEYKGRLISVDSYMNIQLSNTEEFIDNKSTGSLGQVLIR